MAQQQLIVNGNLITNQGATLSACGVKDNDLIVVRRRQQQQQQQQQGASTRNLQAGSQDLAAVLSQSLSNMFQASRKYYCLLLLLFF